MGGGRRSKRGENRGGEGREREGRGKGGGQKGERRGEEGKEGNEDGRQGRNGKGSRKEGGREERREKKRRKGRRPREATKRIQFSLANLLVTVTHTLLGGWFVNVQEPWALEQLSFRVKISENSELEQNLSFILEDEPVQVQWP